jgi:hypothetical protein
MTPASSRYAWAGSVPTLFTAFLSPQRKRNKRQKPEYNIAFDILTEAIQKMGANGITRNDVLPNLVDFTATIAVALGGEDAIKACIIRMGDRITDYHAGRFPVTKE